MKGTGLEEVPRVTWGLLVRGWENLAAGKWTGRSATEMCGWDQRSAGRGCEGLRRAQAPAPVAAASENPQKKHVKARCKGAN